MRKPRFTFTLNPEREEDRRVMEYLNNSGKSVHQAIVDAVIMFQDQRSKEYSELLRQTKDIILNSLKDYSGDFSLATKPSVEETKAKEKLNGEIADEFLSFFS